MARLVILKYLRGPDAKHSKIVRREGKPERVAFFVPTKFEVRADPSVLKYDANGKRKPHA